MRLTFRLLLVVIAGIVFIVGLLLGQQTQRSKFERYLRPATVTPMDVAVLRTNIEVVKSFMQLDVPTIYYSSSCKCFTAHTIVTSELAKQPLDEVRRTLMARATIARRALAIEFPEMSKPDTVPDRDFKMTFFELNTKNPDASRDLAEYVDGKIVFK
jgi:hypothetical protein